MTIIDAAEAMVNLERMVAAVKGQEVQESKFAKALATLKTLSRQEGIPLAIVGGLAAIHHGYERFTKDIDVVVRSGNLDILTRVAPQYGIKVIWNDPEGWHKLQCEGVPIDVVPEGRKPRKDAPTAIPSGIARRATASTPYAFGTVPGRSSPRSMPMPIRRSRAVSACGNPPRHASSQSMINPQPIHARPLRTSEAPGSSADAILRTRRPHASCRSTSYSFMLLVSGASPSPSTNRCTHWLQ